VQKCSKGVLLAESQVLTPYLPKLIADLDLIVPFLDDLLELKDILLPHLNVIIVHRTAIIPNISVLMDPAVKLKMLPHLVLFFNSFFSFLFFPDNIPLTACRMSSCATCDTTWTM